MRVFRSLVAVLPAAAAALSAVGGPVRAQDNVAKTDHKTPEQERLCFRLPPGFEAQLVAAEPDIQKPLNICFDDRGRLWVTDTVEYPFPAKPGTRARDTVKILEDFDENGRARKITTFADDLNIPIGLLPIRNGVIVHGIPNIWRITDTDGDGKGDKREVLLGSIGSRDTHGMTSAFTHWVDGWVYACHGFANDSTIKAADGSEIRLNSGNTYRFRPDGSRIEQFTWGQVNPFGLSFDPWGNLYSADCHSRPVYMLLRGAYYPSFGKPHDGLGFGPEMCRHTHGSTAICGITAYAADHFPAEFRGTLFIGNVMTNRINHDNLDRQGSTLNAVQRADFLSCTDPWFRPVDIKLGPDGALYVADFYNRIIGHYEVPLTHPGRDRTSGRIWRIVYKGADGKGKAVGPRQDWTKATVDELVGDLAHANLTVRTFAGHRLVELGKAVVEPVKKAAAGGVNGFQRAHGLWVLERLGALPDAGLLAAIQDAEPLVRVHALRVAAERKDWTGALRAAVLDGLKDGDGFVARAAADALSTHPGAEHVAPLAAMSSGVPAADAQLAHTVRMALRNQLRVPAVWSAVDPGDPKISRAVADVALGVPSAEAAAFLPAHAAKHGGSAGVIASYARHTARYGSPEARKAMVEFCRKDSPGDAGRQGALLKAYQQGTQERGGRLDDDAKAWADGVVTRLLDSSNASSIAAGLDLVAALRLEDRADRVAGMLGDRKASEPVRKSAGAALAALRPAAAIPVLGKVLLDPAEAAGIREACAAALGGINQPAARSELLRGLLAAPDRLQSAVATAMVATPAGANELLTAVEQGKASARLLQERPVQVKLGPVPGAGERAAKLTKGLPAADKKILDLIAARRKGLGSARTDIAAGEKVFEKHCAACHQVGGKGSKVGPQLDGIGVRGAERILEDVLDPNRNVDAAFRTTVLGLNDGRIVTGLFLREEGEVIVLADQQGKDVRVPRNTVEQRTTQPISPMPANWSEQIPEADLYHLTAYLLSRREPLAKP
jgi:putative heme-binding domain-containing protein